MQKNDTYFRLGETDFGIGKVSLAIDRQAARLSVEIKGSQELTQRLAEDGPFNWVLYPPKLYLYAVPYLVTGNSLTVTVDEQLLDEFDAALYLLEHNDLSGTLTVVLAGSTYIEFEGATQLDGEAVKLSVRCKSGSDES